MYPLVVFKNRPEHLLAGCYTEQTLLTAVGAYANINLIEQINRAFYNIDMGFGNRIKGTWEKSDLHFRRVLLLSSKVGFLEGRIKN